MDACSEERSWSSLNNELLSLILSRLVISDYLAFQSVCKSWKLVTSLPHSSLPISLDHASPHDTDSYQAPHLMYLNHKTRLFHFHDPTHNANYSLDIPQLLGDGVGEVQLYYASCGWLLLRKGYKSYFFFNPSTKVKIDLPDIICKRFDWMCFSGSPTSSKCEIVGLFRQSPDHITCMGTLRLGKSSWELMFNMKSNQNFVATNCSPVAHRGNFYILGDSGNLGKFRILPEGNRNRRIGSWKVIGKSHRQFKKYQNLYLLESDGDLMCVATLDVGEVHVLKLDCDMMWQRVNNLNGKSLYVSYWASFARKVMAQGVDNKIYFPRFYDNKGLFYCLATKQWRNFPRSFSSKGNYNTSEVVHSVWTELPNLTDSSN
ncbi:F-box/kelch-repeat protein At1g57790-like [Ipomoea triloba]|uniref:F-box/kelch-repeat protein At1g57790-like n=1 Tax=Ipomoea triloba TaxID=35885 RepID=UPI00125D9D24|nr:F-box/kelch-repeat protein At1g57790-like [Ipomoea triloba]